MNVLAILRRRSTWIVLILVAVALSLGQRGYGRWRNEPLRRELVGWWSIDNDDVGDRVFFDADGTSSFLKARHWWVADGLLYVAGDPPSANPDPSWLFACRIKDIDERSLILEPGVTYPFSFDFTLFQLTLGHRFEPWDGQTLKLVRR